MNNEQQESENVIPFNPFPSLAHRKLHELGLTPKIWKHVGSEGINVHDEGLKEMLVALGCKANPYQPEKVTNPERLAWEVILPREVEATDAGDP